MCWINSNGEVLELDFRYYKRLILPQLGENPIDWTNFEHDVPHCNHLSVYISQNYVINIPDNWQHWNGGVFLFDDSSAGFLDYWHEKAIAEFADTNTDYDAKKGYTRNGFKTISRPILMHIYHH